MQKTFKNSLPLGSNFPHLPRLTQISNSHCGPATIQMLLRNLGYDINQEDVVEAGDSSLKRIHKVGMNIWELALATKRLVPDTQFWMKDNTNIWQLKQMVEKYPVGVEWQGEFLEYDDDDNGHYSVVTNIDDWDNLVYIADPYEKFAGRDRKIPLSRFEELWWDVNEIRDLKTGRINHIKDYHMMFVITPKDEKFPLETGMIRG